MTQLGRVARSGAGFLSLCSIFAAIAMIGFMLESGISLLGAGFLCAFSLGAYLFIHMTLKGRVPSMFRWLE